MILFPNGYSKLALFSFHFGFLAALGGLFSTHAFAAHPFVASAEASARTSLDVLSVDGIAMNAIQTATAECLKSYSACEIKTVSTVRHNQVKKLGGEVQRSTEVSAVVQGLEGEPKRDTASVITQDTRWNSTVGHSALEIQGIRKDALFKALAACYQKHTHCIDDGVKIIQQGKASTDETTGKTYYTTGARAQVLGFE
ncbi:MAG: hypothetical protein HYX41_01015 [Bdellovibrio sp.]|nr:hypothetical protein [Bdellovibrio sp.]